MNHSNQSIFEPIIRIYLVCKFFRNCRPFHELNSKKSSTKKVPNVVTIEEIEPNAFLVQFP